ncbi:MAG: hypothetical protein ABIF11_02990 [Nitrospirota bacterium]
MNKKIPVLPPVKLSWHEEIEPLVKCEVPECDTFVWRSDRKCIKHRITFLKDVKNKKTPTPWINCPYCDHEINLKGMKIHNDPMKELTDLYERHIANNRIKFSATFKNNEDAKNFNAMMDVLVDLCKTIKKVLGKD